MNVKFNDEELKYMWGKLVEIGQKKVVLINNSYKKEIMEDHPTFFDNVDFNTYNAYDCLPDNITKQIAPEFFKRCEIGDVTMILLNKGFNVSQINQILKAREKELDLDKYIDKKISAEELRNMRDLDNNR